MLSLIHVWVVLQIVMWQMLCTLCIHYDCFYICKDLTEGEINQSIILLTKVCDYDFVSQYLLYSAQGVLCQISCDTTRDLKSRNSNIWTVYKAHVMH